MLSVLRSGTTSKTRVCTFLMRRRHRLMSYRKANNMQRQSNTATLATGHALQRKYACNRPVVANVEGTACPNKRLSLQRHAVEQTTPAAAPPPIVHEVLRSPGRPLDPATRAFMEPRFGRDFSRVPSRTPDSHTSPSDLMVNEPRDRYEEEAERTAEQVMRTSELPPATDRKRVNFSQVRVHDNSHAARAAQALNARAFTLGRDIVFGPGEHKQATPRGRKLLAHELAHVMQQESGNERVIQRQPASGTETATTPTSSSNPAPSAGGGPSQSLPATIKFWVNAFIPDTISGAITVPAGPLAGQTMFEGPFTWSDCFMTDNRGFDNRPSASSRTHVEAEVDVSSRTVTSTRLWSSGTKELDCEDGDIECSQTAAVLGGVAPAYTRVTNPFVQRLAVVSSASDPCVSGAPDVDVNGVVTINTLARHVEFEGLVDPFPAFEMYVSIDGRSPQTVFRYFDASKGAFSLIGPPSTSVSGRISF